MHSSMKVVVLGSKCQTKICPPEPEPEIQPEIVEKIEVSRLVKVWTFITTLFTRKKQKLL